MLHKGCSPESLRQERLFWSAGLLSKTMIRLRVGNTPVHPADIANVIVMGGILGKREIEPQIEHLFFM